MKTFAWRVHLRFLVFPVFAVSAVLHFASEQDDSAIEDTAEEGARAAVSELDPGDSATRPEHFAKGLTNVIQVAEGIWSGSEPHGQEGFTSLAALGVRTVVSVDGARPDLENASQYHLRYVHIPIGYDGIGAEAGLALARLVREAERPIYIHCHHGRHRGPAAAAVACRAAGVRDAQQALEILNQAGTSPHYKGLWRDVADYQPPAPGVELPPLVPVAQVDSLTAAMAQVDRAWDRLELCRESGWQTPEDHPDVVPQHEALMVREGLYESTRHLGESYPVEFREWLEEAQRLARQLETALASSKPEEADRRYRALDASCRDCHEAYRD